MKKNGFDQLPVTKGGKKLLGLVTLGNILANVKSKRAKMSDPVTKVMFHFFHHDAKKPKFEPIYENTPLESLSKFFEIHSSAVVTEQDDKGEHAVKHVVTKIDLLTFLVKEERL
jgi:cystathionine beta-synthase